MNIPAGHTSRQAVIWVMLTTLVAILPHLTRMSPLLALSLLGLIAWRVRPGFHPPHWLLRTIAVVVVIALVLWLNGGLWGRLPGSQLLCGMLVLKSLELQRLRDALLIVSLGFFVIATWFLFDQSPLTFIYLIAATWLGLTSMIVIHRRTLRSNEIAGMFRQGARLALPAIPIAIVMFFLFPRLSSPLWGIQGGELEARTGLSDSMSPGDISDLFIDDSPAFRVRFEGQVPPMEQRYWRGPVLWRFDGQSWQQILYGSIEARVRPQPAEADLRYEVELEPHRQRWIYALDYPAVYPDEAKLSLDYMLRTRQPVIGLKRYEIASDTDFTAASDMSRTLTVQALQLPDGVGKNALELAGRWQREAEQAFSGNRVRQHEAIAARALAWFRNQPFHYRLDSVPLFDDPIDEFLFESRTGYCEHYASAFTFLMRAAGVPARVVTGYQGGIDNGDYMLIRQSDAHAWSEIWLDDKGWTRIDPTTAVAPARVHTGSRSVLENPGWLHAPWLVAVRDRLDVVRYWWNRHIVSFDAGSQSRILQPLGIHHAGYSKLVMLLLAITTPLGLVVFWWLRRTDTDRPRDPLQRAWRLLLGRLRRAGVECHPGTAPLELQRAAARRIQPLSLRRLQQLLQAYRRFRYAPPMSDHPARDRRELARKLQRFRPRRLGHSYTSRP